MSALELSETLQHAHQFLDQAVLLEPIHIYTHVVDVLVDDRTHERLALLAPD